MNFLSALIATGSRAIPRTKQEAIVAGRESGFLQLQEQVAVFDNLLQEKIARAEQ